MDALTLEQTAKLEILMSKAETGGQWAEICRLESLWLKAAGHTANEPRFVPSWNCESGKRPRCTCSACF